VVPESLGQRSEVDPSEGGEPSRRLEALGGLPEATGRTWVGERGGIG
jgi:hypothetical protein